MAVTAKDVSIQLTAQEEELFSILMKTLEYERLTTVLRCAGGWVRDKLLNTDSHDIDLAVDNKLGQEMAQHINNYLSSRDMQVQKVRVPSKTTWFRQEVKEYSLAQGRAFWAAGGCHHEQS